MSKQQTRRGLRDGRSGGAVRLQRYTYNLECAGINVGIGMKACAWIRRGGSVVASLRNLVGEVMEAG